MHTNDLHGKFYHLLLNYVLQPLEGLDMDEEYPDDVQSKDYQDYITFKPQALIFLSDKGTDLVHEHSLIISGLRKRPMTVKEIHNLYYDIDNNKHTKAIKTIYRYLEKLEEEGLVTVAGHRITEGVRVADGPTVVRVSGQNG